MISDEVLERYSRQILLPEIDLAGQGRLSRARVVIVGLRWFGVDGGAVFGWGRCWPSAAR
jgi:molybdopterin/thiamine biosynthesis adenylyltransferase